MVKDKYKEELDYKILIHNNERRMAKDTQEMQHQRVCQLEKTIRTVEAEKARLKSDYERLCNSLQHTVGNTIMDTLRVH